MAKTIPMVRENDGKTADVHPAEVENLRAAGWKEAEKPKADAKPVKRRKAPRKDGG